MTLPSLDESARLRLATFATLYFAQGVPWGFISVGYVVLLADLGLDNATVGAALGLAYLPWSFKILWGPLLDSVPALRIGRRRPFIIFAEAMMGVTLLALWFVDPLTSLGAVSALLFLNNTFASLQDVAVDAMAVDLLREDERGRANAFMWAGKSFGVSVGGGGGLLLSKWLGWGALFLGMAGLMWLILLIPLFILERKPVATDRAVGPDLWRLSIFLVPFAVVGAAMYGLSSLADALGDHPAGQLIPVAQPFVAVFGALLAWPLVDRRGFAAMRGAFTFATPWWGVGAAIVLPIGYAMVMTVMSRMMRADLLLSEEQIAFLSGAVDPISGVVGALIGGVLADRLGVKRAIALALCGVAVFLGLWGSTSPYWGVYAYLVGWTIGYTLCVNAFNASSLGLFMSIANPRVGATQFAVYMAGTNLTYSFASPLGGLVADNAGYVPLFLGAAVLQLTAIAIIWPINVAEASARYRGAV